MGELVKRRTRVWVADALCRSDPQGLGVDKAGNQDWTVALTGSHWQTPYTHTVLTPSTVLLPGLAVCCCCRCCRDFINAFLTFIFVIGVLYFCVVVPL